MKLEDVRSAYQYFSEKASDIVRQLGFAGIALIWLFHSEVGGKPVINSALLPAGFWIILALTCDLLHYVAGTLVWGIYNRRSEQASRSETEEFTANPMLNWPILTFFWGKVVCIIIAYVILGAFVVHTIVD